MKDKPDYFVFEIDDVTNESIEQMMKFIDFIDEVTTRAVKIAYEKWKKENEDVYVQRFESG